MEWDCRIISECSLDLCCRIYVEINDSETVKLNVFLGGEMFYESQTLKM